MEDIHPDVLAELRKLRTDGGQFVFNADLPELLIRNRGLRWAFEAGLVEMPPSAGTYYGGEFELTVKGLLALGVEPQPSLLERVRRLFYQR